MDSGPPADAPVRATVPSAHTAVVEPPTPAGTPAADADPRPRRKEVRRLQGEARRLEPWERYRALTDAMDEVYEAMDHSNREARFALLVMGILNAFVAISASRPEVVGTLEGAQRPAAAVLLGVYAVAAMYFLYQAIEALRPGKFRPQLGDWQTSGDVLPIGIRYYEDVISRDALGHWQAWHEVQVGQLNAELALQFHSLCFKSNVKRVALVRLFAGLRLMTMLVAALMVLYVYAAWM